MGRRGQAVGGRYLNSSLKKIHQGGGATHLPLNYRGRAVCVFIFVQRHTERRRQTEHGILLHYNPPTDPLTCVLVMNIWLKLIPGP